MSYCISYPKYIQSTCENREVNYECTYPNLYT